MQKEPNTVIYQMNMIGYMLSKMVWHSDNLMESMLQKMLGHLLKPEKKPEKVEKNNFSDSGSEKEEEIRD